MQQMKVMLCNSEDNSTATEEQWKGYRVQQTPSHFFFLIIIIDKPSKTIMLDN